MTSNIKMSDVGTQNGKFLWHFELEFSKNNSRMKSVNFQPEKFIGSDKFFLPSYIEDKLRKLRIINNKSRIS